MKFWTNQTVEMQTALGAAIVIDAISKAANGEITTAGALPANAAWVVLQVSGMRQLNNRIFRVSESAAGKFKIGVDTQEFANFAAGTFRVITFGAAFTGLREPSGSGGDPVVEDTTTIHDPEDTEGIVSSSPQGYNFTHDWEPTNAALMEANKAFITRTPRAVRFADPDGSQYGYFATVSATLQPTVSGRKKVTPVAFRLLASGTAYGPVA